ncbi:hypothetical protein OOZ63_27880 [Paucibacter sp. PLA-PC-4]|uniref:hypothetical protein n=1 Tax=Paucibacter sp. PLA-PC-4 TaxID=2993655 RepID=UPI00224B371F|nr:hypothetical protein [Paucibacter sp. PLA-PC-4]MCX2865646.1 hypothetical protein [Paucibacter sp. PLA-PC-4]
MTPFATSIREEDLEAQRALEREYMAWAGPAIDRREEALGKATNRDPQQGEGEANPAIASPTLQQSVMPAAMGFVKGFMPSLVRSTVTPYVSAAVSTATGSENVGLIVGGAVGGLATHLVEHTLVGAVGRQARSNNVPTLEKVDVKALVPDPGTVHLEIEPDGRKRYRRSPPQAGAGDQAGVPVSSIQEEVQSQRLALEHRQKLLSGKSLAALLPPSVTGGATNLRNLTSNGPTDPHHGLLNGTFSAVASGISDAAIEVAKNFSTASVQDLAGGTERVNLFRATTPHEAPAAKWSVGGLVQSTVAIAKDTADLVTAPIRGPERTALFRDAGRNMAAGSIANVAAASVSSKFSSGHQDSHELDKQTTPGFPAFAEGFASRFAWTASRELMKDAEGGRLERLVEASPARVRRDDAPV